MEGQLNLFETEDKPQKKYEKQKDVSPEQTYDERMKRFWHYWNNKTARENQIETCEGELRIIVEALADYSDYVSKEIELMEHGYGKAVWEHRLQKIKDVQRKIENSIGYCRDEQLVKCQKKGNSRNDDIGEDALILALK